MRVISVGVFFRVARAAYLFAMYLVNSGTAVVIAGRFFSVQCMTIIQLMKV